MNNKKGFTLIEIIICIILITTISTISIVLIKNNNETNDEINKKILEAANIFVEVEKDENGNKYLEEIVKGAKGVKVPVSTLVDKGYIDKSIEDDLYKNTTKKEGESYYVMFLQGGENKDYCNENEITSLASWMYEGKTVYLCNNYDETPEFNKINILNEVTKMKVSLDKIAVSENFYINATEEQKAYLTAEENGLFTYYNEETRNIYTYYRGAVENNYLKLGEKDGNELLWRILWFRDDNKMKLVLDDEVVLVIKNKGGEDIDIDKDDFIQDVSNEDNRNYYILNPLITTTKYKCSTLFSSEKCKDYRSITYEEKNLLSSMIKLEEGMYKSIYFTQLKNWYEDTTLSTYDFITKNKNFCVNDYWEESSAVSGKYNYYPSDNFDCKYGSVEGNYEYNVDSYSSPVGFLTYGETNRAGLADVEIDTLNVNNSKNFLLSKNNNYYPLVDIKSEESSASSKYHNIGNYWNYYYVRETGIDSGEFYKESRRGYNTDALDYYTLYKPDGTMLYKDWLNADENGMVIKKTTFKANSVKPVIVIDMKDKELLGDGTDKKPFTIVEKTS